MATGRMWRPRVNMETFLCSLVLIILPIVIGSAVGDQTPVGSSITSWKPEEVPNPETDTRACGVPYLNTSYVCDPNLLLANTTVVPMEHMIGMTFSDTRGVCTGQDAGYKVAVAVLNDIDNTNGLSSTQQRAVADNFASTLRENSWNFGTCGNDVVIVVSRTGNTIGVSVGLRAESRLLPNITEKLVGEAISRLNSQTIGNEMLWLLSKFYDHLTDTYMQWQSYRIFAMVLGGILLGAIGLLFLYLITYCCIFGGNTSQKKLRARRAKAKAMKNPSYMNYSRA